MDITKQLSPQRIVEFSNSIDRFVELQARKARLDAEILTVLGTIGEVIDEVVDAGPQDSRVMDQAQRGMCIEVGAAARIHDRAIMSMVNNARPFVKDFPKTLEALAAAKISVRHAYVITDVADRLLTTPEQREVYESQVLPKAMVMTTNQLREAARRVANRLTEKTLDDRHKEAATTRDVWVSETSDGMALLIARLTATQAYAAHDRLTRMARAADPTGRKFGPLRADLLTDLILTGHTPAHHPKTTDTGADADGSANGVLFGVGEASSECSECVATEGFRGLGGIQAQVSITIPLLALLPTEIADIIRQTPGFEHVAGLDGAAELTGYGPIDSQTALFLAGNTSGWDRILVHPISGTPLRTDRYTPSQEIKRMLKTRDVHCRFPWCRMSAGRCDNDHTIPYSRGGPTDISNLAVLCKYHHTFKHESGWEVTQLDNGTLKWTSVLGRTYITEPPSNEMYRGCCMNP